MPFLLTFQLLASIVTPALAYPLTSNNTLKEGLVRRMDAPQSSLESRSAPVHPCHLAQFASTSQHLYRTTPGGTLQACGTRKGSEVGGIAFWPLNPLGHPVTCGLVWPNMLLTSNQKKIKGTCFSGPQDPTDISKGLSPCQEGFKRKESPFYHQPPYTGSTPIDLAKCKEETDGVAWRGMECITLPSDKKDDNSLGDCYVYNEASYREWYLGQVVGKNGEKRDWWNKKRERTGGSDWIELDLSNLPSK